MPLISDDQEPVIGRDTENSAELYGLSFEIEVRSVESPWPPACDGVRAVLSATQKMLEAAASGQEAEFENALQSLLDSANSWQLDLFGEKP